MVRNSKPKSLFNADGSPKKIFHGGSLVYFSNRSEMIEYQKKTGINAKMWVRK